MAIVRTALGAANEKPSKADATWTPLTGITLAVGDVLVVGVASESSVAGSTLSTWNGVNYDVIDIESDNGGNPGNTIMDLMIWYITSAGTGNIVINFNGTSSAHAMFATKITGLASNPALDVTSGSTGSSGSPSDTGTSTHQAVEIFIAALATQGPTGDAAGSWSNSWTAGQRSGTTGGSNASNQTIQEGFKIVSATESSQAALTGITSRQWAIGHATYKGASGTVHTQSLTAATVAQGASLGRGKNMSAGLASMAGGIIRTTKKVLSSS